MWLDDVLKMLEQNQDKKTILIGGASSAGKTYRCKRIKEHLEANGRKCLMISLDNFYRPLSLRMTDFAIKQYPAFEKYRAKIYKIVSDATRYSAFDEKFCDKNKKQIIRELGKTFDNKTTKNLLKAFIEFYHNVNFDIPESMDFEGIVKQINCKNGKIVIPSYSFTTSERITASRQVFDKNDFDYIIFEGIFALRPEIKKHIDKNKTLTIALKADNMTMFSRRMYRDIVKAKRTRSPQQTFESYFEQVLPCFDKYVKKCLDDADITVDAHLTQEEISKKAPSPKIVDFDYEICDKINKNAKIFIKNKDNLPDKLVLEYYDKDKTYQDVYDFKEMLNQKDIKKVLSYFESCGFEICPKEKTVEDIY